MKVLVTAASKHGATREIAERIAETLESKGLLADCHHPGEVSSLDRYWAVVLGSSVYFGSWIDSARNFVERFASELRDRPVWLFSSGPIGHPPRPEGEAVDVARVRESTGALEHQIFSGRLDKSVLGFGERAIVSALRASEGDFRDWAAIESWASHVADQLSTLGASDAHPGEPRATGARPVKGGVSSG